MHAVGGSGETGSECVNRKSSVCLVQSVTCASELIIKFFLTQYGHFAPSATLSKASVSNDTEKLQLREFTTKAAQNEALVMQKDFA